jgi:hypothetical protein
MIPSLRYVTNERDRESNNELDYLSSYARTLDYQVKLFLEQRILTGLVNASKLTQNDQSTRD